MPRSTTTAQTEQSSREATVALFREVQGEVAEALKDLSEQEYESLIAELTRDVNAALADWVRRSRGEAE